MKFLIFSILLLSMNISFAGYRGFGISPEVKCYDLGITPDDNTEDRDDKCYIKETDRKTKEYSAIHTVEGKKYRIQFNTIHFYKLYVEVRDGQEITYLLYNGEKFSEDTGVLPGGKRTFEPGILESLEWRFHTEGKSPGFHALIARKSTFDLIAKEPRTVFHVFKLESAKSCLLGFVDEIEMARRLADKADEIPCE